MPAMQVTTQMPMPGLPWGALTRAEWLEMLAAGVVVAVAILAAAIVSAAMRWAVHRYTRAMEAELDDTLVRALRRPAVALIVLQGVAIAAWSLSYLAPHADLVRRLWLATTLAVLVVAAQRIVTRLLYWYAGRPLIGGGARLDPRTLPMLRRVLGLAVWLAGGLVVLGTLGIEISPLLAGLGIGGVAVALALQPLLANVFASSYMLSDQSIRVGDRVEIAGGPAGTIEDIGWRATRIRGGGHEIVIVPNSTLATAIVTNYDVAGGVDAEVALRVGAASDLDAVERVCRDELTRVRDASAEAMAGEPPVVRYEAFEGRFVRLTLRLRAAAAGDTGALRHAMIRGLHARLRAEGIDIR